jgi:hypothetical protein
MMTEHADVVLRFPLPLPANAQFQELTNFELSRIVASNFHPGEQVRIRPKDRVLEGEFDAEGALAARSTLAGQALTISSTTIEILSDGYYRARHGVEGHDIQIAAAALVDAVPLECGYGVMVRHNGQNLVCLFEEDDVRDVAAEDIKFRIAPTPVDEYGRYTRWGLDIDRIGQTEFDATVAAAPIAGEFHIRRSEGKLEVVAVPWTCDTCENEMAAIALQVPGFAAPKRQARHEPPEMTL